MAGDARADGVVAHHLADGVGSTESWARIFAGPVDAGLV